MSKQRTRERPLSALKDFLHDEAAGGIVLVIGAFVAVVWANSAVSESYADFWGQYLTIGWGPAAITEDLQHWVNDALMAVFFFVVGLEIKRELAIGELHDPRAAALPAAARCRWRRRSGPHLRGPHQRRRRHGVGHPDGHRHRLRRGRPGPAR